MKQVLIFHGWVIFHNVMSVVYSQKIAKNKKKKKKNKTKQKNIKKLPFGAIPDI